MNADPTSTPPALVNQIIPTGFIITITYARDLCSMTIWSNTLVQQSFFPFFHYQKDLVVSESFATGTFNQEEFAEVAELTLRVKVRILRDIPGSSSVDFEVVDQV